MRPGAACRRAPCQPPTPPPASPRVLIVRRRTESSRRMVVVFAFFGFLSVLASPVAGLGACSVVAGGLRRRRRSALRRRPSAPPRGARAPASRAAPLAWSSASCCWRRASSSRSSICFRVDRRRRRRAAAAGGGVSAATAGGRDFGRIALDEDALLAHLDLHRAVLAGGVGLLDLAGLLARQRDLVLRLRRAVHLAQVLEQARLVLLGERILGDALLHAGGAQLLEQHRRRNLQLARELGDAGLSHVTAGSPSCRRRRTSARAPP